ncbi:MAG: DNA replication/repair protein RecF [Actinomycetota bacterium]
MRLLWFEAQEFRNHAATRIEPPDGLIVCVGLNAQGKTNLLEAIFYLLTLRTPRVGSDEPLIRRGADAAYVRGEIETRGGRVLVEVEIRPTGANRIRLNRSAVRRRRDVRREVKSVLFLPEDLAIVQGEPEHRRGFLDESVEALWPIEETARRGYERALRQRNRLLKEHEGPGAPPDLEAWDQELVKHGVQVVDARARAMDLVEPAATAEYESITGDRLIVRYQPSVEGADLETAFRERLAARRNDELVRRRTLVGPHRDDLGLAVGDLAARRFASHGEAWAAALCLRLGLAEALEREAGEAPLVLLDDPFSGLDPDRRARLGRRLTNGRQTFISVPERGQAPEGALLWEVKEGRVEVA